MSDSADKRDSFEEQRDQISTDTLTRALQTLREKWDHRTAAFSNSCVHCGICADSCHYYLTNSEVEAIPAFKLNLIVSVFRKHFSFRGKMLPGLTAAKVLDRDMVKEWIDSLFGRCTLCGRCMLNCTAGINITQMIRLGRSVLAAVDLVPRELQSTVDTAVVQGNNMGIPEDEWLDTLQWLEEELRQEVGDLSAALPVDHEGARIIYAVNPREIKFFPLSLLAAAKIFYAADEKWTFARGNYDVTNYGLFSGDDNVAGLLSKRLLESAKKLGIRTIVLGECGHGFNANRWEAPEWLAREYDVEVISIVELLADYVRHGRIQLDPKRTEKAVTLHDPCNLVRLGGISENQRFVLKNAVTSFVEMHPNREKNFCCGGGGGQLSMTKYAKRRLRAGSIKAEQIRNTRARIVVAPCHNCIDQLGELNREYKLGVEVKTLSEIVAEALVIPPGGVRSLRPLHA